MTLDLPPESYTPPSTDTRVHAYNSKAYYESKDAPTTTTSPAPPTGLTNESMTCFLNSLMQALFYTLPFRNAIYSSSSDPESPLVKSLAKLFATLEMTSRRAVSTKELTEAFGWGDSQRSYQSDIHELQTILFDSLSLPETITDLYEFEIKDQIEFVCSNPDCQYNNCRGQSQTMTELMISVSPGNFPRSLKDFEGLETLDGDNKIECDKCKTRSDAKKYQCVSTLPKVLNICLRRLEFCLQTLTRKRVHDSFEVPLTVELGEGLSSEESSSESSGEKTTTYHLNSAIVHSGTANGGHYYSYNRYPPNSNTHWVKCNDGVTTIFTNDEFKKVLKLAGSTVYMMVYIQDTETPVVPIPPSIATLVEADEKVWKKEKVSFDIKQKLVNVIVVDTDHKAVSGFPKMLMETQKAGPLIDYIAKTNYAEFVDECKFRLRKDSKGVQGETFNGREDETLLSLGTQEYSRSGRTVRFMIERTPKSGEWEDRKSDDIKLTCIVVDPRKVEGEIENPSETGIKYLRGRRKWLEEGDGEAGFSLLTDFYIGAASTVGDLKIRLGSTLNVDPHGIFVFADADRAPVSLNGPWDGPKSCRTALPAYYNREEGVYLCVYAASPWEGFTDEVWKGAYNVALNSLVYSYNDRSGWKDGFDLDEIGEPSSTYGSEVRVDQNKTFSDLMMAIREKEGLSPDFKFHLVQATGRKGLQVGHNLPSYPDVAISDVFKGEGSTFHVVLGEGLARSECWVQFNERGGEGGGKWRTRAYTMMNENGTTVLELKKELLAHLQGGVEDHRRIRFQCGRFCSVYMKDSHKVGEFESQRRQDSWVLKVTYSVLEEAEEVGENDHAVNVKIMDVGKRKVVGGGIVVVNVDKSTDVEDLCARLGEKYGGRVNGEVEISKFIPNKVKVGFAALLDDTKSVYAAWTRGPGDVWSNGLVDLEKLRKNRRPRGKSSRAAKPAQAESMQMSV
ncbi:hypothetical protein TrRE_jg9436, partial [Triparma retinervis]